MEHSRISVANVVVTSAGSVLTCMVLIGASLAIANPDKVISGKTGTSTSGFDYSSQAYTGMDLPMSPPKFGTPQAQGAPTTPISSILPDEDDGDDPRDTPPPTFFGEEIDTETDSILYVVDHSGSMSISAEPFEGMNGTIQQGNRLDRAKAELKRSISALPESFFFNVFFFDECVDTCWNVKQPATAANKVAAFAWIDAVQPDGWTNTGLAAQSALTDKDNKTIVLLSDGSPNFIDCAMNYVGSFATHQEMIRNENTQGATVNTFGIGISSDNDARTFMQAVAFENAGSYTEIN